MKADFWKVNIFRIILLVYMLAVGGIMLYGFIHEIVTSNIDLEQSFSDAYFPATLLMIFVLLIWLCCVIIPLLVSIYSLILHKNDDYTPCTPMELSVRIMLTLVKMLVYAFFSGFLFLLYYH